MLHRLQKPWIYGKCRRGELLLGWFLVRNVDEHRNEGRGWEQAVADLWLNLPSWCWTKRKGWSCPTHKYFFFPLGRCNNITFKEKKAEGESNEKLCKQSFVKTLAPEGIWLLEEECIGSSRRLTNCARFAVQKLGNGWVFYNKNYRVYIFFQSSGGKNQ